MKQPALTSAAADALLCRPKWRKPANGRKLTIVAAVKTGRGWVFKLKNGNFVATDSWLNRYLPANTPHPRMAREHLTALQALGIYTAEEAAALRLYWEDQTKSRVIREDRRTLEGLQKLYGLRFKLPPADKMRRRNVVEG